MRHGVLCVLFTCLISAGCEERSTPVIIDEKEVTESFIGDKAIVSINNGGSRLLTEVGPLRLLTFKKKCRTVGTWIDYKGLEGKVRSCGALIPSIEAKCPSMRIEPLSENLVEAKDITIGSGEIYTIGDIGICVRKALERAEHYFFTKKQLLSRYGLESVRSRYGIQ